MTDQPTDKPVTEIDARLQPFRYASDCDINAMKAAVELVNKDPAIVNLIAQVRGADDLGVDFNCDKNRDKSGALVGAANREWASALIAAAQISFEKKLNVADVPAADIEARGKKIYDDFKTKEQLKGMQSCGPIR